MARAARPDPTTRTGRTGSSTGSRGARRPVAPAVAAALRPNKSAAALRQPGEPGRQSPHLHAVGAGNSFGRLSGGQGGGCPKSRGGVTFGAAAAALGAGGFISCPTSRPERSEIREWSGHRVQVWSSEGAATQGRISAAVSSGRLRRSVRVSYGAWGQEQPLRRLPAQQETGHAPPCNFSA